ncbi:MAG: DegT/DnrJ/EryC1/StrS family aminotransferase [Acidimicrobiia bacterium]
MVPVVDLSRRADALAAPFHEVVARVLASGHVLLGPELAALESELAAWCGDAHVVGVSSGAAAIQLALTALGIGPGDEVLVPAFTAVPTASAVCAIGATPVFVDVDAATATVPANGWEAARTDRTKAVIVVHLYGRPAEAPATDLPVIDDAAQAHGALRPGRASAATVYSFYPTKNVGGIGDGGAITSDDEKLAGTIRRLRVHGMTEQYVHVDRSQNFRLSELEAGWLRLSLPTLPATTARRREITAAYRAAAPELRWQADHPDHVHHLAVFRADDRPATREQLAASGVASAVHYPLALTQQPAYRELTRGACPEAEAWAGSCVTVPCFPELSDAEVEQVLDALGALTRG